METFAPKRKEVSPDFPNRISPTKAAETSRNKSPEPIAVPLQQRVVQTLETPKNSEKQHNTLGNALRNI